MSVRTFTCPNCRSAVNAPAAMHSVRCPSCGHVFAAAAGQASAAGAGSGEDAALRAAGGVAEETTEDDNSQQQMMLIAGVGGAALLLVLIGLAGLAFWPSKASDATSNQTEKLEPVLREPTAEELAALTIVDLPETQRKRIYDDVRATARTTTERPLMLPGGKVRTSLEGMLDSTYENSLQQLAALNDISVEDVKHIVEEGDTKNWDPRARSRAYRDGKRVYDDERTQGYQGKKPLQ